MKQTMMKEFRMLGMLLMAGSALMACSNDDNMVQQPAPADAPKVYTVTVEGAQKGGDPASTRALLADAGETITATWDKVNDKVYVQDKWDQKASGTLTPSASTATATLSGTLSGLTFAVNGKVNLFTYNPSVNDRSASSYSGQDGTLAYIGKNCDFCYQSGKVKSVSGDKVTFELNGNFKNEYAIVKFTLVKTDGTTALKASKLIVNIEDKGSIDVNPTSATDVLYMAVPDMASTADVTLTATVGTDTYTCTATGKKFVEGKFYRVKAKMGKLVNLSTLTAEYEAKDGDVLTGTLDGSTQPYKITIADGAIVTLKDATIKGYNSDGLDWAGLNPVGDATIILEGTNSLKGFYTGNPCIIVPAGKKLTIKGEGVLTAQGNGSGAAGIGAGNSRNCGDIEIQGGTITAKGQGSAAGIGGGWGGNCGNISISGGTITATGGSKAPGIGSGRNAD